MGYGTPLVPTAMEYQPPVTQPYHIMMLLVILVPQGGSSRDSGCARELQETKYCMPYPTPVTCNVV